MVSSDAGNSNSSASMCVVAVAVAGALKTSGHVFGRRGALGVLRENGSCDTLFKVKHNAATVTDTHEDAGNLEVEAGDDGTRAVQPVVSAPT